MVEARLVLGWLAVVSREGSRIVCGLALAASVACAALFLRRPRLYWISAALALIAAVMTVDAGLAFGDIAWSRHGVVTHETIARKGIGKDYEPAFDQPLKDGAEFTVLSENGDWIFGHFEGIGEAGYAASTFCFEFLWSVSTKTLRATFLKGDDEAALR